MRRGHRHGSRSCLWRNMGSFFTGGNFVVLCLRYGWNLSNTPISHNRDTSFSVDHAMICHMGGIPTIRHNEIRDITATLLTEICHNVATEPLLQPLTNESLAHRSANTEPKAHLDIRARGFWSTGQDAFLMLGFLLGTANVDFDKRS